MDIFISMVRFSIKSIENIQRLYLQSPRVIKEMDDGKYKYLKKCNRIDSLTWACEGMK